MITLTAPSEFFAKPQPAQSDAQKMQARCEADGVERMVIEIDETGRRIRHFYGDPEVVWGPFKMPGKRVTGFETGGN